MSKSANCERIFLGWNRPFLDSACDWLFSKADCSSHLDLSGMTILCGVGRASRRLCEKLVFRAESEGIGVSPPALLSISGLFDQFRTGRKIVTQLDSSLAFLKILKEIDSDTLFDLFPSLKEGSELKFFEKASLLAQTYQDFTKNGKAAGESIKMIIDSNLAEREERWLALSRVFDRYLQHLSENALSDTLSLLSALRAKEKKDPSRLMLLACYDLSPIVRDTVRYGFSEISSLIFAPDEHSAGFDELGCLVPQYWSKPAEYAEKCQVEICSDACEQIEKLFSDLETLPEPLFAEQITIGALEPGTERLIKLTGNRKNIPLHLPAECSLARIEAGQVLISALKYSISGKFSDLSDLVSLPLFFNRLPLGCDSLGVINDYRERCLQPLVIPGLPDCSHELNITLKSAHKLLSELYCKNVSLNSWLTASISFLKEISDENDSCVRPVLDKLGSLLRAGSDVILESRVFLEIIKIVLSESSDEIMDPDPGSDNSNCIDIVGWLELCLDDAPYVLIAGFNEGLLPAAAPFSSFLTDKARILIGLEDHSYRLARDNYIFNALLGSRKRLHIYCTRNSLDGSPLLPSRLLLGSAAEESAGFIERFFACSETKIRKLSAGGQKKFSAHYADRLKPVAFQTTQELSVSVTSIKDYLKCPYLYYLRHVLKLAPAEPDSRELSALQFGSVLHDLIARFGNSSQANEGSRDLIEKNLLAQLDQVFEKSFGKNPFPEVLVQYHQLAARIRNYAEWQAGRQNEGWQIWKVEEPFAGAGYRIETSSGHVFLRGRIDRIDFNKNSSEYEIIDFKSGDSSATTRSALSSKNGWLDLQLPCYYFYARDVLKLTNIKVGLLPISASSEDLAVDIGEWDEDHLNSAADTLKSSLQAIMRQEFWPPRIPPEKAGDFEYIYRAVL